MEIFELDKETFCKRVAMEIAKKYTFFKHSMNIIYDGRYSAYSVACKDSYRSMCFRYTLIYALNINVRTFM